MSNARPYTEAHAIARADLALLFSDDLADAQRAKLLEGLRALLTPLGFDELADADEDDADESAVAFQRKGIDDEITEEVHLHENYAHVVSWDYRGWTNCRDSAVTHLQPVLELARDGGVKIICAGLAFRDVFFSDEPDAFSAQEIFSRGSRFLPPVTFSSGKTWRHTFNWREEATEEPGVEIYSSFSVDARERAKAEDEKATTHVTEIMHRQQIYGNNSEDPAVEWADDALRGKWDCAHRLNKALLSDLLSNEMSIRIGLKEESL